MLDIVFVVLMAMAIFKGYSRGLVVALFSVLAFIIGIAAALKLSAVVAAYVGKSLNVSAQWLPMLSFALVFIAVVILVRFGARLVEKTIKLALLGWVDRIGGILLYMTLYTIIFSVALFYVNKMGILQPQTIASSTTYPYVSPWAPKAIDGFGKMIPWFQGMFGQLETFFDGIAKKAA